MGAMGMDQATYELPYFGEMNIVQSLLEVGDTRTVGFSVLHVLLIESNAPNDLCTALCFTSLPDQPCSCVASGWQVGQLHEALL